jgi:SAM-dependent methyltransferase
LADVVTNLSAGTARKSFLHRAAASASYRARALWRSLFYAPVIQPRLEPVPPALRETLAPLTPPADRVFVGDGDFLETGFRFLRVFREIADLGADERILEVGCGIGRMAVPLTQYLSPTGRYDGFDIVPEGIDWCTSRIAAADPRFRFVHVDIHNTLYNPAGRLHAGAFSFPYADGSFSFVFLTSVFTHLLPASVERYLEEIYRVLASRGGRCLATMFLLNDDAEARIRRRRSSQIPRQRYAGYAIGDAGNPEAVVFYEESFFRQLAARKGLRIARPVAYGTWCGRPDGYEYQDVVVVERVPNA